MGGSSPPMTKTSRPSLPLLRRKRHRHAVHAVPQPGRPRPVRKHMPQMPAAIAAMDLHPGHEEAAVLGFAHRAVQRLPEAGPAGPTLELRIRGEQRLPATGAIERAVPLLHVQRAGPRALRAMLAQHLERRRPQLLTPFVVGKLKRIGRGRLIMPAAEQTLHPRGLLSGPVFCH